MDASTWIDMLSAAGTVAAAGVAAYSARLAWKQVRFQFEPQLLIPSRHFQIKMASSSIREVFWEKPTEKAAYVNGGDTDYFFLLRNIGNGAAYDASVRIELDFETIFADTQSKIANHAPTLSVDHDSFGVSLRIDGEIIGGFRLPDQAFSLVDQVGSGSSQNSVRQFPIDPSLSFFALCYGAYLMHERMIGRIQPEQRISFDFIVDYTDSSGRRQSRRFPRILIIRGGRWQADLSDGVAFVMLTAP
ncbi:MULTISPECIES: hypothetical protein [Brevundimonas]|jgi:hypothetical protein|uniref:hypothetical protein n=1 Tax=Brevundimonas TaxID=41275 RepID=UPI0019186557|nr:MULTISPECIES: hypothetical protein [Brevundimonas]MBJ7512260.1 hypothetical protein [Brevundimonas sp.]